jgi:hypothetical protein
LSELSGAQSCTNDGEDHGQLVDRPHGGRFDGRLRRRPATPLATKADANVFERHFDGIATTGSGCGSNTIPAPEW